MDSLVLIAIMLVVGFVLAGIADRLFGWIIQNWKACLFIVGCVLAGFLLRLATLH